MFWKQNWTASKKWFTLSKKLPNLTSGVVGKERRWLNVRLPFSISYKFDISNKRSEVVLTGRNRERGTLIPAKRKIENNLKTIFVIDEESQEANYKQFQTIYRMLL